ncbi:hypothetical protein IAT38_005536 [Cryptococcus sp. DSM 104549]
MSSPPTSKRKASSTPDAAASAADADADGFTRVPTREERRKQKKVNKHRPEFQYNTQDFRYGKKITIAHIRDLMLYIVADGQKPQWMQVDNKAHITHTVMIYAPGLLSAHLGLAPIPTSTAMPFSTSPQTLPLAPVPSSAAEQEPKPTARVPVIPKLFTYACPTKAPGDARRMHSVLNTLLMNPVPDSAKKKKEEEGRKLSALAVSDTSPPFLYLLTPNQMLDNDYRLPSYLPHSDKVVVPGVDRSLLPDHILAALDPGTADGELAEEAAMRGGGGENFKQGKGNKRPDEWVETPRATGPPKDGKYPVLAIDCEMVLSGDGNELARVSIIDFESGKNVFDELVKPPVPIIDYRTQWSGITAERLAPAVHTVATIQELLVTGESPLITPHTILMGHSLEFDLTALRIRHPLCIDTATIYKHMRGPPFKPALKYLASKWLGKDIQQGNGGHDSEEDARTCVELLRMKLAHGPDYGNSPDNMEPISDRLSRFMSGSARPGRTSAFCDYGNPRLLHGSKATTVVRCESDDDVVKAVGEVVKTHDFVFGRLKELSVVQGWEDNNSTDPHAPIDPADVDAALQRFNDRITAIHASLPSNSALILLTGQSDPMPMVHLMRRRQKWERLVKALGGTDDLHKEEKWSTEDERTLEARVEEAREGMAFFRVKS